MYVVCMVRKTFNMRVDHKEFLASLPGDETYHITIAIDDYIEKVKKSRLNAVKSPSKSKRGGKNGSRTADTHIHATPT